MNQILSMDPNNPSFGNNNNMNNGNNGGNNGKLSTKTTKRIFGAALIVFGLVMFIFGLIGTITYFTTPKGPVIDYPVITTMQSDNIVTLNIKNDVVIDYIEYNWNENPIQEFNGEGKAEITRDITIPAGENVLTLNIVDINGKMTKRSKVFTGEFVPDTTPPALEVVVVGSKINITAKAVSETKLSYLTYKWNDDQEIILEATGDQTSIETSIDVMNGTNTLTIVVVNEKGIKKEQVNEYKGIKKPVITVTRDEEGLYLLMSITHEAGIKSAEIMFNGKNIALTADQFGADKKVVERRFKLIDGTNTLKIVATSMDDSIETFNGNATKK